MKIEHLGRWIFTGEGVVPGYLRVRDDHLEELCHGAPPPDAERALIMPSFINAHTHLGDAVAYPAPRGTVEELVAPPLGYKHRVLRETPRQLKVSAMREAFERMSAGGTSICMDFREEGVDGVRMIREASLDYPRAVVLGRPSGPDVSEHDISEVLRLADGIGMSAARDWPLEVLMLASRAAKREGKLFALHASETVREDIDGIMSLSPDYLVHMTAANPSDLQVCADAGVPIVVCPRSNAFFGLNPNIPRLLSAGVTVALGTDNCMINRPDMFEELKAAYQISNAQGVLSPACALYLATFAGRKVLNAKRQILTEITESDDLVAVRVRGDDPLMEMVTNARTEDVLAVMCGGKLRRPRNWRR